MTAVAMTAPTTHSPKFGQTMNFRRATRDDIGALAAARWAFRSEDPAEQPIENEPAFRERYEAFVAAAMATDRVCYWIAEQENGTLIAHLAVCIVDAIPRPSRARDRWGYLTDCYVSPAFRNQGFGAELLRHAIDWSRSNDLELLLVWPSERADAFYARAGFETSDDVRFLALRDYDAPPQQMPSPGHDGRPGFASCPECGLALEAGRSCREYLHDMLAVESEVPFAPGGEPHFFALASYNLQHPSGFVPAMLIGLHQTLADVLAARATIAEARRRAAEGAAGRARVRRDASAPLTPAEAALRDAWPTRWPLTVRHVIDGGPAEYVARVRELAESVVATLEPTMATVGRTVNALPAPRAR